MSASNIIFRCDNSEKNSFMLEAEKMGLNASLLLRRMIHLFLTDKPFRDRVLNLQSDKDSE